MGEYLHVRIIHCINGWMKTQNIRSASKSTIKICAG
jgi:hypothetical protein